MRNIILRSQDRHWRKRTIPSKRSRKEKDEKEHKWPEVLEKQGLFASAISRCVFKKGRITVAPEAALRSCGLLHDLSDDKSFQKSIVSENKVESEEDIHRQEHFNCGTQEGRQLESWEKLRLKNLSVARLEDGWIRYMHFSRAVTGYP